ncbi:Cro/Cl family transcriptional regulator [Limnohabitans sp. MMS-10A-192]|uniref:transcriptional regulator n=1 Tax=Limnohabitans sp. MMS-10A-192 TaxID=1835769 RepID=UPI000D3A49E8|nr:helix-turn-helix domain-containing protein [Limnohabitans sp. MMS-10A-192]PUE21839.1 Cro/Cl family transcriptional regulator [Limnohabitans sp. MMS-10A-192]
MNEKNPLEQAIRSAGSINKLAMVLGVSKGAVWQWGLPGRQVPAEHCPAIERITGGMVRCEQLRPDVDWAYLRIPSQEGAAA